MLSFLIYSREKYLSDTSPSASPCLKKLFERLVLGSCLTALHEQRQHIDLFTQQYIHLIDNLTHAGQGWAFLGGYHGNGNKDGHSMIYEIEKRDGNKYYFRKIHAGRDAFLIEEGCLAVQRICCDREHLIGEEFIALLSNNDNRHESTLEIETKLEELFSGSLTKRTGRSDLQQFGSCAMTSIWRWLEYHLKKNREYELFTDLTIGFSIWSRYAIDLCCLHFEDQDEIDKAKEICDLFNRLIESQDSFCNDIVDSFYELQRSSSSS